MKSCSSCRQGELKPCREEMTLEMEGETVTLPDVPAEKCSHCGTVYYDIGGSFEGDYSI